MNSKFLMLLKSSVVLLFLSLTFVGCENERKLFNLVVEIKCPNNLDKAEIKKIKVDFITDNSASGTAFYDYKGKLTGDFLIFSPKKGWCTIVIRLEGAPEQAFRLNLPRWIKPSPWTGWLYPDYFQSNNNASWDAMNHKDENREKVDKSTAFQIRYKIIKHVDSVWVEGEFRGEKYYIMTRNVYYGETLERMSKVYKISLKELRELNNLYSDESVHEGQEIKIPIHKIE